MKDKTFWITMILIIAVAIVGLFFLAKSLETDSGQLSLMRPVNDQDHSRGPVDAEVVLVEYADFECSGCAVIKPIIDEVFNEFDGQVRHVFRHYPLLSIHEKALITAQASEAASVQGKFWEMHDILFENQELWVVIIEEQEMFDILAFFAQEIGLDVDQFNEDLNTDAIVDEIGTDLQGALEMGLTSTPTIFINGDMLRLNTQDDIRDAVVDILSPLEIGGSVELEGETILE
ncbi:MAG: thioredoxin domain-containing protein [Parcubacteria group bacterium]